MSQIWNWPESHLIGYAPTASRSTFVCRLDIWRGSWESACEWGQCGWDQVLTQHSWQGTYQREWEWVLRTFLTNDRVFFFCISIVGVKRAVVADSRKDTCSREVFRHDVRLASPWLFPLWNVEILTFILYFLLWLCFFDGWMWTRNERHEAKQKIRQDQVNFFLVS